VPSFGVCAVLIYRWIPKHHEKTVTTGDGYGRRLLEGWRFLRKDKLMMPLVLMIAVTNLLDAAVGAVLLPVWIKDHGFGPGHTSLILTSFGVTATLFALLASAIGERIPRKLVFTLAFLICGAPRFVVMAYDAPVWALMAVYAVGGVGAGFINPVLGALFAAGTVYLVATMSPVLIGRHENWKATPDPTGPSGTEADQDPVAVASP
jgi:predicted MFS family arabinose efflux permease